MTRTKKGLLRVCWLIFCALCCAPAEAKTRLDLNGEWLFRTDPTRDGMARGWSKAVAAEAETVEVPHTWNVGKYDDYEGVAWYFKTFTQPDEFRGKHVELNFGATFYRSRVWLNGVELGSHEGGHTAYHFNITPHLQPVNFIAVEIDNRPTSATIPGWALRLGKENEAWYDWWHYGGIVRDVWLSASAPAFIRRQQIRVKVEGSPANVATSAGNVATNSATVTTRVFLENFAGKQVDARLLG